MAKLYNFKRLIDKYSQTFTLITEDTEGSYVGGKYVKGRESSAAMTGAIVPVSDSKVYQSGGTLTSKDRQLFMKSPITNPLPKSKVQYKGNTYSIEQGTVFEDYADAHVYVLKWVEKLSDRF